MCIQLNTSKDEAVYKLKIQQHALKIQKFILRYHCKAANYLELYITTQSHENAMVLPSQSS